MAGKSIQLGALLLGRESLAGRPPNAHFNRAPSFKYSEN